MVVYDVVDLLPTVFVCVLATLVQNVTKRTKRVHQEIPQVIAHFVHVFVK